MQLVRAKFDWYQSTVCESDPERSGLVDCLLRAWDLSDWVPAKNFNGYTHGGAIVRGEQTLCHLTWGGQPGINCKSTSDESPVLEHALRLARFDHRPTRVDACLDLVEPGLFDCLAELLIEFAVNNRISICQQGDWIRGQARTLYLGSKLSPVRMCVYEKGFEQGGGASLDWVRIEVRVRPKTARRKDVASWTPSQVMSSGFAHDALKHCGLELHHERAAVGSVWRPDDEGRARAALLKQWGNIMKKWADDAGSWEAFGVQVGIKLEEIHD